MQYVTNRFALIRVFYAIQQQTLRMFKQIYEENVNLIY